MPANGQLFCGDNLEVLREYIPDASVDLVYLDPPFKSDQNYNLLFREKNGTKATSQILAFEDTWEWNLEAERNYSSVVEKAGKLEQVMVQFRTMFPDTDMLAYLSMMAPRLVELRRVLKPTGSIYLHCDSTASHYLKLLMDAVFGPTNFRNEITWKRTHAHGDSKRKYANIKDCLLFYTVSDRYTFNPVYLPYSEEYINKYYRHVDAEGRRYQLVSLRSPNPRPNLTYDYKGYKPHRNGWAVSRQVMERLDAEGRLYFPPNKSGAIREKYFLDEMKGVIAGDVWADIPPISAHAQERLGYPTQKPVQLLQRIIAASSNEGEVVLDPFCGCGTAIEASYKSRKWIGIDLTYQAMRVIREERFPKLGLKLDKDYEMVYRPRDITAAEAFAKEQPFQFQDWVIQILHGEVNQQLSGDKGIDGRLYFRDSSDGPLRPIIVSVKGGKLKAPFIRELAGAVSSERAPMGVLVVIHPHSKQMVRDAARYGFFNCSHGSFPKIQIVTVKQILGEERLDLPPIHRMTWKKRSRRAASQLSLPGIAQ